MTVSIDAIERALARAFPELLISPVRRLATGFGSVALETAGGVVFRIPRERGTAAGHAREVTVLPRLRDHLATRIPDPIWRIEPGDDELPLGAIGYRKIAGSPLTPALARVAGGRLAADLAEFLAALHTIPRDEAERLGLSAWLPPAEAFAWHRDQTLPALREALDGSEYRTAVRWYDALLADESLRRFPEAVRHGDPWYGNVIVDPTSGRLKGVVDWEGVELGDPAWDFAAQLYLGEPFLAALRARYVELIGSTDPTLEHRALKLHELREFGGVRRAAALGDDAELEEAIRKLRRGGLLARPLTRARRLHPPARG